MGTVVTLPSGRSRYRSPAAGSSMTVSRELISTGVGPPMEVNSYSERVRPSLSRHTRTVFCRTTLLPSGAVSTVSLVPMAE
jgi:hypothetical protein